MPPRPRRAAAVAATKANRNIDSDVTSVNNPGEEGADPEFLALSAKQRRAIDRAFERGVAALNKQSRKRRKVDKGKAVDVSDGVVVDEGPAGGGFMADDAGAGGFMDDEQGGGFLEEAEGGFMIGDDEAGGGFLPDNEDEGGFLPDDNTTTPSISRSSPSPPTKIPLHILPGLLTSLGLPSDEDVLGVFRASASGWEDDDASRRKRGEDEVETKAGVELKDFRAVCAALMGPDDGEGEDDNMEEGEEDTFELPSESELSSLESGSSYGGGTGGKDTGKLVKSTDIAETASPKVRGRGKKAKALEVDLTRPKLSSRQKELVKDLWEMLKPPSATNVKSGRGADVLGREEVKSWVRTLGEMWSDEEITEMVTLFSSQHEGRGLSYDDFGLVMLRAGLV